MLVYLVGVVGLAAHTLHLLSISSTLHTLYTLHALPVVLHPSCALCLVVILRVPLLVPLDLVY